MNIRDIQSLVVEELSKAQAHYPPFNTEHEGYAILLEEVDELWDEIKRKQSKRDKEKIVKEAIQVAAMAMRFVVDLYPDYGEV